MFVLLHLLVVCALGVSVDAFMHAHRGLLALLAVTLVSPLCGVRTHRNRSWLGD